MTWWNGLDEYKCRHAPYSGAVFNLAFNVDLTPFSDEICALAIFNPIVILCKNMRHIHCISDIDKPLL